MVIAKESRRTLVSTDSGSITAVDVQDRYWGLYHLQFITLDSSSLLLPVILHTDMVFYVHSGRGAVNWITEDRTNRIEVRRGDIYRLEEGTVFYVESHPDPLREKLRIHAIFNTMLDENHSEGFVGAYSNIINLVRGFDDEVLQMAFGVSEEVIQGIKGVERPPPIVHYEPRNETDEVDWREGIFEALIGGRHPTADGKKKKKKEKTKTLNLVDRKPDIENCNGRSVAVTSKEFKPLKGSDIGIFMVNLTKGSMMGPHWNPKATEIAIVTHGQGIVQVVCPSKASGASSEDFRCRNTKLIKVKEGDIFIVPRYHPMAQISFNNDSFVFVGFATTASQNHPQFLAGKRSVLRTIDREMLGRSFNAANATIDHLLDSQIESVVFECATCAEGLEEKIERKREEEEARKKEEERKREKEESRRREEEEAARKREEEEARKREEEEARKREEEKARRREEEEARKREEEEARRREEEEARRREEEEEARKREEKEARKREEEEAKKREEEEEARRKEEEEAKRREEEEEEARKREEEGARKSEEEEQRRREEEEEAQKREEEEERRREEEEEQRKEEEEMQKRQEEEAKRQEEEEEARGQQEEEEAARRREEEEEEARRREGARREKEEAQEQGEAAAKKTEEEQKQMQVGEEEQEAGEEEQEKQTE